MSLDNLTLDEAMRDFSRLLKESTYEPDYFVLTPDEYEARFGVSLRPKKREPFTDKDGNYMFYDWADSLKYRRDK